jgi:hypothetical protein
MSRIYTGKLSAGGFIGPEVTFTRPGQRTIVIDRSYASPIAWEARSVAVLDGRMMVSARRADLSRSHFTRFNPIDAEQPATHTEPGKESRPAE